MASSARMAELTYPQISATSRLVNACTCTCAGMRLLSPQDQSGPSMAACCPAGLGEAFAPWLCTAPEVGRGRREVEAITAKLSGPQWPAVDNVPSFWDCSELLRLQLLATSHRMVLRSRKSFQINAFSDYVWLFGYVCEPGFETMFGILKLCYPKPPNPRDSPNKVLKPLPRRAGDL